MQFALPPRRNPHTSSYARSPRLSLQRRKQLKAAAILGLALVTIFFLLTYLSSSSAASISVSTGTSSVVIVTVLDRARFSDDYVQKIIKNREDYASRHGYINFFASVSDYDAALDNAPRSWAIVPAIRHAMASHPRAAYFFHLDPHALIMNPSKSLESHVLEKNRLQSLMLKETPVVPPDSIIKTFSHLKPDDVDLIMSTDSEDLNPGSLLLRQGEFARFFLDLWFEPLYRKYNFQKAEMHALDHIIQWHPTVLARLALVPQRIMNAYSKDSSTASVDGTYKDGDLIIRFFGCDSDPKRNCEKEMDPYYNLWAKKLKSG
ncbi:putative alpha-1,6-mannosyltransferase subunit [Aspergillus clavatus NRRL 1]|uniref:Alpha-1,6-mannosyltransferase subunit, putative n=1 Tax=Aspergillus clavatus (strain ATCC 1007 / CBS 513.65 / DSM 816 / NCTC 3887 / NRRL 1 / QM 1276 / 107) TaxID=344612 RepID=A1CI15_ASPCL|nr:alpha-1,6-mannosyltransferase subunit, putative [Aspergillus clavatus NRRL 1]EAW10520.1 alpha-1,6-mannosyltransferase subunit, putative [Aspergillus clavatus NRRL 1]